MRKHHVIFYSPGTLYNESSSKEIKEWDIPTAIALSKDVVERYNAKPYGFNFSTSITKEPIPDGEGGFLQVHSKEVKKSGMYFLGGRVRTIPLIEAEGDKDDRILLDNMRWNNWNAVVENTNSYRCTLPFESGDFIVDQQGNIIVKGSDYYDK